MSILSKLVFHGLKIVLKLCLKLRFLQIQNPFGALRSRSVMKLLPTKLQMCWLEGSRRLVCIDQRLIWHLRGFSLIGSYHFAHLAVTQARSLLLSAQKRLQNYWLLANFKSEAWPQHLKNFPAVVTVEPLRKATLDPLLKSIGGRQFSHKSWTHLEADCLPRR